jgi:hypothetical protein
LDANFKITSTNNIAKEVLRFSSEELLGNPLDALVTSKEGLASFKEKVTSDAPWSGLLTVMNKDKQTVPIKVSAGKIFDAQKGTHKYLIFASEISEVAIV